MNYEELLQQENVRMQIKEIDNAINKIRKRRFFKKRHYFGYVSLKNEKKANLLVQKMKKRILSYIAYFFITFGIIFVLCSIAFLFSHNVYIDSIYIPLSKILLILLLPVFLAFCFSDMVAEDYLNKLRQLKNGLTLDEWDSVLEHFKRNGYQVYGDYFENTDNLYWSIDW